MSIHITKIHHENDDLINFNNIIKFDILGTIFKNKNSTGIGDFFLHRKA